jgi:epoxyqueuosine reductase
MYGFVDEAFKSRGYKLEYIFWLPMKRLAVRSGLAEYGRNNIVFSEGLGSFVGLAAYKSDIPCGEEYTWREVKNMNICDDCRLCIDNCPTKAIQAGRFLIDNEKCLTKINDAGTEPFPDWVPATAHHRITGCIRCQDICPKNKDIISSISETVDFSDEETNLLLAGTPIENLPESLAEKARRFGMEGYYASIPRNLKAMLENA